jgi:drug/metabolite transporter (DMT)-like permease
MPNYDLRKGVIYCSIGVFLIGLQPVIANSRPKTIDPFIFGGITALIEALIFMPFYFIERKTIQKEEKSSTLLNGWKKKRNLVLLFVIGLVFSAIPIMLYIGFDMAGAINSSLALKSEIVVAIFFGYLLLNERISKIQIIFCFTLFFGLFLAITEGFKYVVGFDLGVLIILISVILFTFIHALTKISFDRDELFPSQVVFLRNLVSGILVTLVYAIIFPLENLNMIFYKNNFFFFLIMGIDYGFSLFVWYKALSYIEIGKATIIISFTPIVSSFFSYFFLGESFTIFHLIGTIIIIMSIIMIVKMKKRVYLT